MRGNAKPRSSTGFRLSSSWQDIFRHSIEPGNVITLVKRAINGRRETSRQAGVTPVSSVQKMSLADVKTKLAAVLDDCGQDLVRLRTTEQVMAAASVAELWLMRCDIYQCVARQKGQREATRRINSLLPVFEGWIPPRQLTPVA